MICVFTPPREERNALISKSNDLLSYRSPAGTRQALKKAQGIDRRQAPSNQPIDHQSQKKPLLFSRGAEGRVKCAPISRATHCVLILAIEKSQGEKSIFSSLAPEKIFEQSTRMHMHPHTGKRVRMTIR